MLPVFRLELLKALSDNGKDISYFEELTGKEPHLRYTCCYLVQYQNGEGKLKKQKTKENTSFMYTRN